MPGSDITEQNQNNLPMGSFEEAEQLDDGFIPNDAQHLCSNCLSPCHPLQYIFEAFFTAEPGAKKTGFSRSILVLTD